MRKDAAVSAKRCPAVDLVAYTLGDGRCFQVQALRRTTRGSEVVGSVYACRDGLRFVSVQGIGVRKVLQRCGLGTKLYERAAEEACERFQLPLASDIARSSMAEGFWSKQARKGRAVCLRTLPGDTVCYQYALKSCAVASLGRARLSKIA